MIPPNVIGIDAPAASLPDSFHALRLGFNQAFLNEDFDLAKRLCADSIPLCEGNESLLAELAQFHMLLGNMEPALQCLDNVLAISPENHSAAIKPK